MPINRPKLMRLSRDRSFLIKAAATIGISAVVIGFVVSHLTISAGVRSAFHPDQLEEIQKSVERIEKHLGQKLSGIDAFRFAILYRDSDTPIDTLETNIKESESITKTERVQLISLLHGLHGNEIQKKSAEAELANLASEDRRFSHEFYGMVLDKADETEAAILEYQKEATLFDEAYFSRRKVIDLLKQRHDWEQLRQIYRTEPYHSELQVAELMAIAAKVHDFGYLFRMIFESSLKHLNWWSVSLGLFSAAIWFVIIGQFRGLERGHLAQYFASIVLGIFSTFLTVFVIILQRDLLDFTEPTQTATPADQVIFWIAGVGLREEFLKLLCFIPIAFFLKKRAGDLTALLCAGMVGLGFALQENIGVYFGYSPNFQPWGRFLTATFFHIALTGIVGLAFFQMIRRRGRGWEHFLAEFLLMVFAHGMFNAVQSIPLLADYSSVGRMLILALVAYRFFRLADGLMQPNRSLGISPLSVFVIGSATLVGVVFVAVCVGLPFRDVFPEYLDALAGMVPIAFIYINQFRDA